MTLIKIDSIRNRDHFEGREIDVKEWMTPGPDGKREPAKILVRQLSTKEMDRYESSLVETKGGKRKTNLIDARAKLAVLCCINEDGTPYFQPSDVEWLTNKAAIVFDRIYRAYIELNGVREEDEEDLEKNFE